MHMTARFASPGSSYVLVAHYNGDGSECLTWACHCGHFVTTGDLHRADGPADLAPCEAWRQHRETCPFGDW